MGPKSVAITCPEGHTFTPSSTSGAGTGRCPFCAGNKVWPGFNDLATVHPDLAAWWDRQANVGGPETVLPGSTYEAGWRCPEHGHTWRMRVATFVNSRRCPFCTHRRVWPGFNDRYSQIVGLWEDPLGSPVERGPTGQVMDDCPSPLHPAVLLYRR